MKRSQESVPNSHKTLNTMQLRLVWRRMAALQLRRKCIMKLGNRYDLQRRCKRSFSNATIVPYKGKSPIISPKAFIASSSSLIGDIVIEDDASIWYGCVLRGDVAAIRVGKRSNVQDGTIIHVNSAKPELNIPTLNTIIGDDVTIGHGCILHACELKDRAFIGMQSCIMDGAIIESDAMVAAGSLVTIGKVVKSGELWAGRPAKFLKKMEQSDIDEISAMAQRYVGWSKDYM